MTMNTQVHPSIRAHSAFRDSLDKKHAESLGEVVNSFTDELDDIKQFDALIRAFDTLVHDVHNKGINRWSTALLNAVVEMADTFMSSEPTHEFPVLVGFRIEDAARAGLRGRRTASRYVPYTGKELLCVLIATAAQGYHDPQLDLHRRDAVSIAGEDLNRFRSIVEYHR